MGIIKKDFNKVEVETEIESYKENFNSKLTQEDKVDIEEDNILNDYNPAEVLAAEIEEFK